MYADVLIGVVMPPVVEFITKDTYPRWMNFSIAFVLCVLAGTISAFLQGTIGLSTDKAMGDIGVVFLASQSVFNLYWKGSLMQGRINERLQPKLMPEPLPIAEVGTPEPSQAQ